MKRQKGYRLPESNIGEHDGRLTAIVITGLDRNGAASIPHSRFLLNHALSRRKGSSWEDGDAIEFHDLGDGVLAIFTSL